MKQRQVCVECGREWERDVRDFVHLKYVGPEECRSCRRKSIGRRPVRVGGYDPEAPPPKDPTLPEVGHA